MLHGVLMSVLIVLLNDFHIKREVQTRQNAFYYDLTHTLHGRCNSRDEWRAVNLCAAGLSARDRSGNTVHCEPGIVLWEHTLFRHESYRRAPDGPKPVGSFSHSMPQGSFRGRVGPRSEGRSTVNAVIAHMPVFGTWLRPCFQFSAFVWR